MFQAGEYEAANAFLEEFDRSFGKTPLAPDVLLLHAMIDLKSCRFDDVRATLDKLVKTYGPLQEKVAALIKDPEKRTAFYRRLLSKRSIGHAARSDHRAAQDRPAVLQVLRRHRRARSRGGADARPGGGVGRADRARDRAPRGSNATEAVRLVNDVEALRPLAAGDPADGDARSRTWRTRPAARRAWATSAAAASPRRPRRCWRWRAEARKLRAQLVVATSTIANKALVDLDKRLRELLRRARLTHIDAVIGKKKKLEIEIANLRQGRFPADLFATLQLEGLMGDDEEYWPFEGEYWSDEYENYK